MTHRQTWLGVIATLTLFAYFVVSLSMVSANPDRWKREWGRTVFSITSVDFKEIISGGPPKDGIPSIDRPRFIPVSAVKGLEDTVPVISFSHNGDARAYPLGILMRHEIVNDVVGGMPVAVTYCPLCNSSIVFDRTLDGELLDFGTTGKLRNSDLVMYDRQTESWWQQFLGEAIVGQMTGQKLKMLPSRVEAYGLFKDKNPDGKVLKSASFFSRGFGSNPYGGYDTASRPFLYRGEMPEGIEPLARVVRVGEEAWSLKLLRRQKKIETDELVLSWTPGQNSALDSRNIAKGRDIGNVVVQRKTGDGLQDEVYDVTFAFAFHAFFPEGKLHMEPST